MSDSVKALSRRDRAARTRLKILEAARELILERGYPDASMGRIAARADVAVQTVHFVFHTKEELLRAVIDGCVLGLLPPGSGPIEDPEQSSWWQDARTDPDPRRAITTFVNGCLDVVDRTASIVLQARQAAMASDSLSELMQEDENRRIRAYRSFAQTLADRRALRPGIDVDDATDVLGALVGEECYVAFVITRAWGLDRYRRWLSEELPRLLLP